MPCKVEIELRKVGTKNLTHTRDHIQGRYLISTPHYVLARDHSAKTVVTVCHSGRGKIRPIAQPCIELTLSGIISVVKVLFTRSKWPDRSQNMYVNHVRLAKEMSMHARGVEASWAMTEIKMMTHIC